VVAGNSIRFPAGGAISDDGHGKVLLLDANMSEEYQSVPRASGVLAIWLVASSSWSLYWRR
jgi:hypothetical protein